MARAFFQPLLPACCLLSQPRIPVGSPFLKSLRRVATTAFARRFGAGRFFVHVFHGSHFWAMEPLKSSQLIGAML